MLIFSLECPEMLGPIHTSLQLAGDDDNNNSDYGDSNDDENDDGDDDDGSGGGDNDYDISEGHSTHQ